MACIGLKMCEEKVSQNILKIEKMKRALAFSFEVLQLSCRKGWGDEDNILSIKIGLDIGEVFAGIFGIYRPQFSLIGETVTNAHLICLTGEEGCITISKEASIRIEKFGFHLVKRNVNVINLIEYYYNFLYKNLKYVNIFYLKITK